VLLNHEVVQQPLVGLQPPPALSPRSARPGPRTVARLGVARLCLALTFPRLLLDAAARPRVIWVIESKRCTTFRLAFLL